MEPISKVFFQINIHSLSQKKSQFKGHFYTEKCITKDSDLIWQLWIELKRLSWLFENFVMLSLRASFLSSTGKESKCARI